MNIISNKSNIGKNFKIGNFNTISDNVVVGDNVEIGNNVTILGNTMIGNGVKISDGVVIGGKPQHTSYPDGIINNKIIISDNTVLREYVTVNQNTDYNTPTKIGSNCLIMAYSHISHDTIIGNNVILSNSTQIGGHSFIDDYSTLGGGALVHQKIKIGKYCMIGAGSLILKDSPPYSLVAGNPAKYQKLNLVGLRRNKFNSDQIKNIDEFYRLLFKSGNGLKSSILELLEKYKSNEEKEILDFFIGSEKGCYRD